MELQLKSIGSTARFVNWLRGFKDIDSSLLLEVDLKEQAFIAKSFPSSKAVVKYSKISFEEAGYELGKLKDNSGNDFDWSNREGTASGRIMVGIYTILSKVTDVEAMYAETEHDMIIAFDLCKKVQYVQPSVSNPAVVAEYQAETINLKSRALKMVIKCSKISEFFEKCDDDTFINRVCKIASPTSFVVTPETIANLTKISSVFAIDKTDGIKLYSKEEDGQLMLFAYNESNGSFDYLLGYYEDGETTPASILVFKENFLNATKGLTGTDLRFTLDTAGSSRILIENPLSKVIIAAMQMSH